MFIRAFLTGLVSLLIISTHAGCDKFGTAASRRQTDPTDTAEPRIQRKQDAATDEPDASKDNGKPHFRIGEGPDTDHTAGGKTDGTSDGGTKTNGTDEPGGTPDATVPSGEPAELPKIHLSKQHQATCLLRQGDTIPDVRLPDLDGDEQQLSSLYGEKLTVLCFWTGQSPIAEWELSDLGPDVVEVYGKSGVRVVAINYKESADDAKQVAESAKVNFPVLLDEQGEFFAKVATQYLPRTYLLDSDGKILWFDIGYASETRRQLSEAIRQAARGR